MKTILPVCNTFLCCQKNAMRRIPGMYSQPLLANCKSILAWLKNKLFAHRIVCHSLLPSTIEHCPPLAQPHHTTSFNLFLQQLRPERYPKYSHKSLENEKVLWSICRQIDMHSSTSTIWMNLSIVDKSEFI